MKTIFSEAFVAKKIYVTSLGQDQSGTAGYLLRAMRQLDADRERSMPGPAAAQCPTCGNSFSHRHEVTSQEANHRPEAHDSQWAAIPDHYDPAAKFFSRAANAVIRLDRAVGHGRAIFYTVFLSAVALFLAYECGHVLLTLSKDWSGTVQLLFRLMLFAVSLSAIVGLAPEAVAIVGHSLARVTKSIKFRRYVLRQHLNHVLAYIERFHHFRDNHYMAVRPTLA